MPLPKQIKDRFKSLERDAVEQLQMHKSSFYEEIEEAILDYAWEDLPSTSIIFKFGNEDKIGNWNPIKELPKTTKLVVHGGRYASNSEDTFPIKNLPKRATHISSYNNEWFEERLLNEKEWQAFEKDRVEILEDAIYSTLEFYQERIAFSAEEAKQPEPTTINIFGMSLTEAQLKKIQKILDE